MASLWHIAFGIEPVIFPIGTFAVNEGGILTIVSVYRPPGRHRVRATMAFRAWSRAVDKDGLRSVRSWLRSVELALAR